MRTLQQESVDFLQLLDKNSRNTLLEANFGRFALHVAFSPDSNKFIQHRRNFHIKRALKIKFASVVSFAFQSSSQPVKEIFSSVSCSLKLICKPFYDLSENSYQRFLSSFLQETTLKKIILQNTNSLKLLGNRQFMTFQQDYGTQ